MNEQEIKDFIREKQYLFWWIPKEHVENISVSLLTETILNYGNTKDVRRLFDLVGLEKAADIFQKQISGRRVNYHPRTVHFFKLYFTRHAHKHFNA